MCPSQIVSTTLIPSTAAAREEAGLNWLQTQRSLGYSAGPFYSITVMICNHVFGWDASISNVGLDCTWRWIIHSQSFRVGQLMDGLSFKRPSSSSFVQYYTAVIASDQLLGGKKNVYSLEEWNAKELCFVVIGKKSFQQRQISKTFWSGKRKNRKRQ